VQIVFNEFSVSNVKFYFRKLYKRRRKKIQKRRSRKLSKKLPIYTLHIYCQIFINFFFILPKVKFFKNKINVRHGGKPRTSFHSGWVPYWKSTSAVSISVPHFILFYFLVRNVHKVITLKQPAKFQANFTMDECNYGRM
jgi:hypothetical protein